MRAVPAHFVLAPAFAALGAVASAQCADWTAGYHVAGIDGTVRAMLVHDDGSGPELYVGGAFRVAGDVLASNIARWNGTRWAAVGAGRPAGVGALCVWNDGSGPKLVAGLEQSVTQPLPGQPLTAVATWDGATWTGLPPGVDLGRGIVGALAVHDAGSGPALYVGGNFHDNSPVWPAARQIARFDGSAWSPVGDGFPNSSSGVNDLESYDDGSGPRLYAAGHYLRVVPGPVTGPVASFDGAQWQLASDGIDRGFSSVGSLAQYNGSLYAGGSRLLGLNSNALMQRVGSTWVAVGGSIPGTIAELAPADLGQGPRLYAGGALLSIGGLPAGAVAAWDGSAWHVEPPTTYSSTSSLAAYDEGAGARLFAGLNVALPGPDARGIARFDGATWSALGGGIEPHEPLSRMATFDAGGGPALFATSSVGLRTRVGGVWTPVALPAMAALGALAVHDDGTGEALYAVAYSAGAVVIWRWDGTTWSALPGAFDFLNPAWWPSVNDLASIAGPSGPLLVAAGDFDTVDGLYRPFVTAWDGQSWIALGTGFDHLVRDLEVHDAGSGPELYACGQFHSSANNVLDGTARFDGASWVPVGAGGPHGWKLHSHDFGDGARLYATTYDWPSGIRVFDGTTWSVLSTGGVPAAFASYDDGSGGGPELVVAGSFSAIAGVAADGIASFDGASWRALGGGLRGGAATELHVFDDGAGSALFVNGNFVSAGDHPAFRFARYGPTGAPGCVATTGSVSCAGDGGGAACPCGNTGGADRGCGNSANASGATLVAEGQSHLAADNVTLRASGMTPGGAALFFQGTQSVAGGAGAPFGDGVRCAAGAQIRLAIRSVSGGIAAFGASIPGDARVSVAGQLPPGPSARVYQVWYRDAQAFCTTSTFNLSNGVRIVWAP